MNVKFKSWHDLKSLQSLDNLGEFISFSSFGSFWWGLFSWPVSIIMIWSGPVSVREKDRSCWLCRRLLWRDFIFRISQTHLSSCCHFAVIAHQIPSQAQCLLCSVQGWANCFRVLNTAEETSIDASGRCVTREHRKHYKNHPEFSARYCCVHSIVLEVLSAYWFIFLIPRQALHFKTSLTVFTYTRWMATGLHLRWRHLSGGELCRH